MKKRIVYGVANYEELVQKNGYFIDKTSYIEKLEAIENPVFLRPRRFGKSLWCRILECYYNIKQQDDFERLFGHTYIGQHPTPLHNSCFVLHLDFSVIDPTGDIADIEASFDHHCNLKMESVVYVPRQWFQEQIRIDHQASASANLETICTFIERQHLPPLYVIIDEYDNFAKQLVVYHHDRLYYDLTRDDNFLKTFFKTLKEGRKTGAITNVFIAGVLPILIDDLASGFNIANIITLDPTFEAMLGFTQTEVDQLLDDIYRDYMFDPTTRNEVGEVIKHQYNGYHFIRPDGDALYNSTILMYFLDYFCRHRQIPEYLTDMNLKTDLSWVRRITGAHPGDTEAFVDHLTTANTIAYNKHFLIAKFNMAQFFEKDFFPISFYYLT
jgi:hypothetical protein